MYILSSCTSPAFFGQGSKTNVLTRGLPYTAVPIAYFARNDDRNSSDVGSRLTTVRRVKESDMDFEQVHLQVGQYALIGIAT